MVVSAVSFPNVLQLFSLFTSSAHLDTYLVFAFCNLQILLAILNRVCAEYPEAERFLDEIKVSDLRLTKLYRR